jgi:hypothetical protein
MVYGFGGDLGHEVGEIPVRQVLLQGGGRQQVVGFMRPVNLLHTEMIPISAVLVGPYSSDRLLEIQFATKRSWISNPCRLVELAVKPAEGIEVGGKGRKS